MTADIFKIDSSTGTPRLLKNGRPTFPMMFWQTSITEEDGKAFSDAGVDIFTFTRSFQAYEHPFFVGENRYDFSFFDGEIDKFRKACPGKSCIPRVFLCAPYWWLEKHPEECCQYAFPTEIYRHGQGPVSQGTFHESYASNLWRKDMGDALRALIRHIQESDYADCVAGIHIANGHCGEWHYWGGGYAPDISKPMEDYLGMPVPRNLVDRTPEFYDKFFACESDAILHFARIVKEESKGRLLTVLFYCYHTHGGCLEPQHRGATAVLESPDIDIITAPHNYTYRAPGDMAYYRNFVASVATHGKLYVDEADDRTDLSRRKHPEIQRPLGASTHDGSIQVIRREFGYALTHNTGLWYMDIDDDAFHSPEYMAEIINLKQWGEKSLAKPRPRCSEVAIVYDMRGAYYLPKCIDGQYPYFTLTPNRFDALCRAGAPFDCFLACDISLENLSRYKVIMFVDIVAPTDAARRVIGALKSNGRTLIWSYSSGLFQNETMDIDAMRDLTGIQDFRLVESVKLPEIPLNPMADMTPGILPLEIERDFPGWCSVYSWDPNPSVQYLRREYAKAHVWNYLDSNDILSASDGALMVHATDGGEKHIHLPCPRAVTDITTNTDMGILDDFTLALAPCETRIFLLD